MSARVNPAVIILAGGASSRMGQDKSGLKLPDEKTLLEYMLEKYQEDYMVFISGRPEVKTSSYKKIADIFDSRLGPVAGIISSIIWLIGTHPEIKQCIFIPVDLAYLEAEDLLTLTNSKSDIAYFKNSPLPLKVRILSKTAGICYNVINEMSAGKSYPVYKFIQQFGSSSELTDISPKNLTNMNYIEDWESFLNEYLLKSGIHPDKTK